MFRRNIEKAVAAALSDTPVVFLAGARQSGKSTLARRIASTVRPARYLTLDDVEVLAAARGDPVGFLAGLGGPAVLDEVQRAPDLFLAIKAAVDRDRTPGLFFLTGSANVLLLPRVSESLAGRMEVLTLEPLSQGEIEGVREGFIDALFEDALPECGGSAGHGEDLADRVIRGGFPEVLVRRTPERRDAWFGSYVATIIQRDVRDLANIDGLAEMPRLLALLAARSSALLNYSEISRSSGLPQTTVKRYLALLQTTFLVHLLRPWSANLGKRLVKSEKIHLVDAGLASHLVGATADRLAADPHLRGALIESFVVAEIRKQVAWSRTRPQIYHYRTHAGHEVDVVLEDRRGRLVGIEVKAAATLGERDIRGLRALAEAVPRRFHRGVVLYTGRESVPFGPRLHALPVGALWRLGVSGS